MVSDDLEPPSPYTTVDKLILLHGIAMNGTGNEYAIRLRNSTIWAYDPVFPMPHSPPEYLHPLLSNLCDWITGGPEMENYHRQEKRETDPSSRRHKIQRQWSLPRRDFSYA